MTGKTGQRYIADHMFGNVYKPKTSLKPYSGSQSSYEKGFNARYQGKALQDNEYKNPLPAKRWIQGWYACDDMLKKLESK